MAKLNLTSNTTFLYFSDLEGAKRFFAETLGLTAVLDQGWTCIYRMGERSYLGAVDNNAGSIRRDSTSGVLVSLAVEDLQEARRALQGAYGVEELSEIQRVKDLALESFFFTGPEGYRFEVERFTSGELRELF